MELYVLWFTKHVSALIPRHCRIIVPWQVYGVHLLSGHHSWLSDPQCKLDIYLPPSTFRLWPLVSGGMWTLYLCCRLHLGHFVVSDISKSVTHVVGLPADTSAILSRNHSTNLYVYILNHMFVLDEILCAIYRWPLLCLHLAALKYVVYFCFVDDVKFSPNGLYDRVTLLRVSDVS